MILAEPLQVVLLVIDALERLEIPYFLTGSLASSLYAVPRATQGVDLVGAVQTCHIEPLVASLRKSFYIDADMIHEAVRHRSSFNIIHLATLFKVDVYILKDTPLAREEMARHKSVQVQESPSGSIRVSSPEDVVLAKLDWYRMGGGVADRQWRDLLGVLKIKGDSLDLVYLHRWAAQLQLTELLSRALEEIGIKGP